jgi:hypothetical protein
MVQTQRPLLNARPIGVSGAKDSIIDDRSEIVLVEEQLDVAKVSSMKKSQQKTTYR